MSGLTLTKTRLQNGLWEGILTGKGEEAQPDINVLHLDKPVPDVTLTATAEAGQWFLRIPVPAAAVSDGVHTIVISDAADGSLLGDLTLIAGEVLADDLRAEVELLRVELDMLKRAFRRHCLETT